MQLATKTSIPKVLWINRVKVICSKYSLHLHCIKWQKKSRNLWFLRDWCLRHSFVSSLELCPIHRKGRAEHWRDKTWVQHWTSLVHTDISIAVICSWDSEVWKSYTYTNPKSHQLSLEYYLWSPGETFECFVSSSQRTENVQRNWNYSCIKGSVN